MSRRDPPLPPALSLAAEPLGLRLRLAAYAGGIVCVGLAFTALLLPVDVVVEFPGEVVQHPLPRTLEAPVGGRITQLWAAEGARVAAGAALVAVGTAGIEAYLAELDSERREQRARLRAAAALLAGAPPSAAAVPPPVIEALALARWRQLESARVQAELERLGQEYKVVATERAVALTRAATEQEIVAAAVSERERLARLGRRGTAPESAVEAARVRAAEARRQRDGSLGEARVLAARLASIAAAKTEVRAEAARRWADLYVEALVGLGKAQARRARARAELEARTVTAPYRGEIEGMESVATGRFVAAGEPLLRIVPSAPAYRVAARVTPRDRRRLATGDRVRILVDAGADAGRGEIDGHIVSLAAAPTAQRDGAQRYEVEVAFDGGAPIPPGALVAGRAVTVVATAGRRRLGRYLLAPAFELGRRATALP